MRLALLAGVLAVALPLVGAQGQDSTPAKKPKRQFNVIAAWEIDEVRDRTRDAYGLVDLLRKRWLSGQIRAGSAPNPAWGRGPGVLINGVTRGGSEELRNVPIDGVKEIRFLSGPDAVTRHGSDFHAGAIDVILK